MDFFITQTFMRVLLTLNDMLGGVHTSWRCFLSLIREGRAQERVVGTPGSAQSALILASVAFRRLHAAPSLLENRS